MILTKRGLCGVTGAAILCLSLLSLSANSLVSRAQATHPITGRHIAPVMDVGGADWLDRSEREKEEQPNKAIQALELHSGMYVADVGAGTGFYSIRIALAVAPGGVVYANDIQAGMLERLRAKAAAQKVTNIETVLGTESDPRLPPGRFDLVLMVDVYHELSRPQHVLDRVKEALKPNGRLVLLEFRKEDPKVPIRPEHKMSVEELKAEITPEGYQCDKVVEILPWQHTIFFRKPSE